MLNSVYGYPTEELEKVSRVLDLFRYNVLNGDFDGWGIDDNMILCVKQWIDNLKDGKYGYC